MRWAGWLLAFWVACGGSGNGGGGSSAVVIPDGGGPPDGGVASDCEGLVPAPPGAAIAFDVPSNANDPMTCGPSTVDAAGTIAVSAPTVSHPVQWKGFGANGETGGTFDAPSLLPQSKGFMGVSGQVSFVTLWDWYGSTELKSTAATVVGPAFGSGGIALSANSASLTITKVDAGGEEVVSVSLPGSFAPRAAAQDASGAVLALTGSGTEVSGIWIDLAKGTGGQPFTVGTGTTVRARPLLGDGIAIQLDGHWTGIALPGASTLGPAPAWLGDAADFVSARAGKAYAVMPKTGNALGIVSAQGSSCGSVTFPGVTNVSVGIEGTVVGSTGAAGCTKYVWRGALR